MTTVDPRLLAEFNAGTTRARVAYLFDQAAQPCKPCAHRRHKGCSGHSYAGGRHVACSCARDSHRITTETR